MKRARTHPATGKLADESAISTAPAETGEELTGPVSGATAGDRWYEASLEAPCEEALGGNMEDPAEGAETMVFSGVTRETSSQSSRFSFFFSSPTRPRACALSSSGLIASSLGGDSST